MKNHQSKYLRIGLSGKMTSGKSAIAKHLVDKHDFVEFGFADKLKDVACDLFSTKNKKARNRELLQVLGERMRQIDKDVWIRQVLRQMPSDRHTVISDVRYLNEAKTLQSNDFILIRLEVNKEAQRKRLRELGNDVPEELFEHASETELDNYEAFDYVLDSNLPLKDVLEQIDEIVTMELSND